MTDIPLEELALAIREVRGLGQKVKSLQVSLSNSTGDYAVMSSKNRDLRAENATLERRIAKLLKRKRKARS